MGRCGVFSKAPAWAHRTTHMADLTSDSMWELWVVACTSDCLARSQGFPCLLQVCNSLERRASLPATHSWLRNRQRKRCRPGQGGEEGCDFQVTVQVEGSGTLSLGMLMEASGMSGGLIGYCRRAESLTSCPLSKAPWQDPAPTP